VIRLQHVGVTFPPGEAETIRVFYRDVIGLREMPVPPEVADQGWVWFGTYDEGIELHFVPHPIAPDPARIHHFCLQVEDIAPIRARLEAAGHECFEAGAEIKGRERLFSRDPVSNLVELIRMGPHGPGNAGPGS
jgi:catechol 2,3-dioxygenase-like lactoylglutathione lyase family enzyme